MWCSTGAAGQLTNAPEYKSRRRLYTFQFDRDGYVWGVDRGFPNRLVKLDPRTGQMKDYTFPDPKGGNHEILIDREGMIWMTKDGAVWYAPRSSAVAPGMGVLYPDMDKITTLGAYYLNGLPGYPFKVTTTKGSQ